MIAKADGYLTPAWDLELIDDGFSGRSWAGFNAKTIAGPERLVKCYR